MTDNQKMLQASELSDVEDDIKSSMIVNSTNQNSPCKGDETTSDSHDINKETKQRMNNNKNKSLLTNQKQKKTSNFDSDAEDDDGLGGWNCTACTLKNSTSKFKCGACGLKRVTPSTRKPRGGSLATALKFQIALQQEEIIQQLATRPDRRQSDNINATSDRLIASSSTSSTSRTAPKSINKSTSSKVSGSKNNVPESQKTDEDSESSRAQKLKRKQESSIKKASKKKQTDSKSDERGAHKDVAENEVKKRSSSGNESDLTIVSDESASARAKSPSVSSIDSMHSLSPSPDPEPTTSSPVHSSSKVEQRDGSFKITPLEVSGNLIKYSPPTKSGRTGLIIDKKRFSQHSVTVNDVTITFTEFATRQNNYIRKKKRRRDRVRTSNITKNQEVNGEAANSAIDDADASAESVENATDE